MRRGEILGLQWRQVDLVGKAIRVERTKSGKTRIVPVSSLLFKELSSLRKAARSEHVFLDPRTKKPMTSVKTSFKTACRAAGIKGLRFHDLRHTAASYMVEAGIDLPTVSKILGHSTIQMTMRYAHPTPENMRRAVEALAQKVAFDDGFVPTLSPQEQASSRTDLLPAN